MITPHIAANVVATSGRMEHEQHISPAPSIGVHLCVPARTESHRFRGAPAAPIGGASCEFEHVPIPGTTMPARALIVVPLHLTNCMFAYSTVGRTKRVHLAGSTRLCTGTRGAGLVRLPLNEDWRSQGPREFRLLISIWDQSCDENSSSSIWPRSRPPSRQALNPPL